MKEYQLILQLQWRPEVLERILRVVRHRGFRVLQMQMISDANEIQLTLVVVGERPIETLCNQLGKLFDVKRVAVQA